MHSFSILCYEKRVKRVMHVSFVSVLSLEVGDGEHSAVG